MGNEIPTCQMQHEAADKNLTNKIQTSYAFTWKVQFLKLLKTSNTSLLQLHLKEANYKGMVRPVLEYGSTGWDTHTKEIQDELEKVQNRAQGL